MISPLCICRRCGRDGCRGRCRRAGMQGQERNRGGYTVSGYVSQVWEEVWEVSGADAAAAAAATTRAFWVRYYGGSALRAAARWWRGAERAGGRRRGVGVFESSAGVRPCVSKWSVSARHDRACSMAVESPKCWQRGVVRLVERLPGQGARAGCAQDGHTRPRTRVAVALARSGPPASTASEASRGPFLVRGERGEKKNLPWWARFRNLPVGQNEIRNFRQLHLRPGSTQISRAFRATCLSPNFGKHCAKLWLRGNPG